MNYSVFNTYSSKSVESSRKKTNSKEKSRFIKRSPPAVKNFSGLEKRRREYKTKYSLDANAKKGKMDKSPEVLEYSDIKEAPNFQSSRNHKKANSQLTSNNQKGAAANTKLIL